MQLVTQNSEMVKRDVDETRGAEIEVFRLQLGGGGASRIRTKSNR